jgi:hypothetical protein
VVVTLDTWLKVPRSGELAWIEAKNLSTQRSVMVKVARAEVRRAPDENAPVVLIVDQDGLLEVIETADNWAQVTSRRHHRLSGSPKSGVYEGCCARLRAPRWPSRWPGGTVALWGRDLSSAGRCRGAASTGVTFPAFPYPTLGI